MYNLFINFLPEYLKKKIYESQNFKNIFVNTFWLFIDRFLRLFLGFLISVSVAKYLGPEQFGKWNYGIAFLTFFGVVAGLGLESIVILNIVKRPKLTYKILGTAFYLKLAGNVLGLILATILIFIIKPYDNELKVIIIISAIGNIFTSFDVIDFYFQANVMSKYVVWARNLSFFICSAIKILLILLNLNLIYFVIVTSVELLLSAFFLLIVFKKNNMFFLNFKWNYRISLFLLKQSWSLILTDFMIIIYMKISQIMIGDLLGEKELGNYSVAIRLSEVWYFIPMIIVNSVFPTIIKYRKISEDMYYLKLQALYSFITWLGIILALPISIFSENIIQILYSNKYDSAATVLTIHIWAGIFVFQGVVRGKWIVIENLQKYSTVYVSSSAVISVILNYIFIPKFGSKGAAIVTLITDFFSVILVPFLIKETRISSIQLIKSFNPIYMFKFKLN